MINLMMARVKEKGVEITRSLISNISSGWRLTKKKQISPSFYFSKLLIIRFI